MYYIIENKMSGSELIAQCWGFEEAKAKVKDLLSKADKYTIYEIGEFKKAFDVKDLEKLQQDLVK